MLASVVASGPGRTVRRGDPASRVTDRASALAIAGGITLVEWIARRSLRSRASAWLVAYALIGTLGALAPAPLCRRTGGRRTLPIGHLLVAGLGYPVLRSLAGGRSRRPPDPLLAEALALSVVAVGEELSWARHVEPRAGGATAMLFALKHVAIDGNARRVPALVAFWWGLAGIRSRSRITAAVLHVLLNVTGVALGHLRGRDQF